MMRPHYRDILARDIPTVRFDSGIIVKIICSSFEGKNGPVQDLVMTPQYLDVSVPAGVVFTQEINPDHAVFGYIFEGRGVFGSEGSDFLSAGNAVLLKDGLNVRAEANSDLMRFLLVSGQPLEEPVAWKGPIVMNTEEELRTAFQEFNDGTFIKAERT